MSAQQRRATTPDRRQSRSRQEVRPALKKGGGFPNFLIYLALGGSVFGGYKYLTHEDPPGIERVQPQLFRGELNAEQRRRYAHIEQAVERAKKCSLYAWPVLETLDYASWWANNIPANILLSTLVVESGGKCNAIPWVYDNKQKAFIPASSAAGPVQILKGTRKDISRRILQLNIDKLRDLRLIPPPLVAPYLSEDQVRMQVEIYLNSSESINENLGLNLIFAGEYYQILYKHYNSLRAEEPWLWAILAWYTGPGAADKLLESLRESGLPLLPDEAFKNPDRELIAIALSQIPGQGGWPTAQKHYFKMMDALTDTSKYLEIKKGKKSSN